MMFDSEMKVMEIIWECEDVRTTAKNISIEAERRIGWNKNTTYTVIKKLIEKGYVRRDEPGFVCTALIGRDDVRKSETQGLIRRFFNGSKKAFLSSLIDSETFTEEELEELREMIDKR